MRPLVVSPAGAFVFQDILLIALVHGNKTFKFQCGYVNDGFIIFESRCLHDVASSRGRVVLA